MNIQANQLKSQRPAFTIVLLSTWMGTAVVAFAKDVTVQETKNGDFVPPSGEGA